MPDTESAPGISAAQVSAIIAEEVSPTTPVASQAAMLALPDFPGQRAIRTDLSPNQIYIQTTSPATTLANWQLSTADVASEVAFVPNGNITETNTQDAIVGVRDRAASDIAALRFPLSIILHSSGVTPAPSYFVLNNLGYWEYPKSSTKSKVVGGTVLPAEFDASVNPSVTFRFVTSSLGAGSANIRYKVTTKYFTSLGDAGSSVSQTFEATAVVTNTIHVVGEITLTLNAALMNQLGHVTVSFERVPGHVLDTFTGNIAVAESVVLPVKETV
jgi:hypothetical protein